MAKAPSAGKQDSPAPHWAVQVPPQQQGQWVGTRPPVGRALLPNHGHVLAVFVASSEEPCVKAGASQQAHWESLLNPGTSPGPGNSQGDLVLLLGNSPLCSDVTGWGSHSLGDTFTAS